MSSAPLANKISTKYSYPCHENCNITFPNLAKFLEHHYSAICNPPRKLMCEGCPNSTRIFVHIAAADSHIHVKHESGHHAKCMMCNENFVSTAALERHIAIPCTDHGNSFEHKCDIEKCTRKFFSKAALDAHKRSARHNHITPGLKCFGTECKREFNSPSAMLAHLESGSCVCGANRNSMRKILMDRDTMGIVTNRAAVKQVLELEEAASVSAGLLEDSRPATPSARSQASQSIVSLRSYSSSHSLSTDSSYSVVQETDSESDIIASHHEGAVYLPTPLASSAASSGVLLAGTDYADLRSDDDWSSIGTPSSQQSEANYDGSDSESLYEVRPHRAMTPSGCSARSRDSYHDSDNESIASDHTEVNIKPFCDLCTEEERAARGPFPNLRALEQHQKSVFHAPAVYHCPKVSFVKGLTGTESVDVVLQENHDLESRADKSHQGRTFKTLQGLAAHVESNACKGGNGMFVFALDFLSKQLEAMGLKGKLEYKGIEESKK